MSDNPVVRLAAVSKSYSSNGKPTEVLVNVDLMIEPGQKASLIGPSGSGKSTLLSLIAGLLRPDSGLVEIEGLAMTELDDRERAGLRARRIGIALQSDNLIPFLTARENVELALAFTSRESGRSARAKAMALLDRFGIADRANHLPRQLSGGETQRVALAVSLANQPALLLADEMVGQLDSITAGRVIDELLAPGFALLFVTHDVSLADRADHRFALVDKQVVAR